MKRLVALHLHRGEMNARSLLALSICNIQDPIPENGATSSDSPHLNQPSRGSLTEARPWVILDLWAALGLHCELQ